MLKKMNKIFPIVLLSALIATSAFAVGLDANTSLLMHMNEEPWTDSSTNNNKGDATETVDVDLGVAKWGAFSADFDGDSGHLVYAVDADYDFFGSLVDSWTIDFWVKHTDHGGSEAYIKQGEDGNNNWILYHVHGTGIAFYYRENGNIRIDISGGEIDDNEWHHIAYCKVAEKVGFYKDGTQVAYKADMVAADTFNASIGIGRDLVGGASYFNGLIDEFRIQRSNYFNAAPNVGLTNTITPPSAEYDDTPAPEAEAAGKIIIVG